MSQNRSWSRSRIAILYFASGSRRQFNFGFSALSSGSGSATLRTIKS